jgi:hypothetical protein
MLVVMQIAPFVIWNKDNTTVYCQQGSSKTTFWVSNFRQVVREWSSEKRYRQ